MKYLKYFLVIVLVAFSITRCGKDWLELTPQGQALEDTYYKTDEEVLNGLSAAYDVLQTKYYHGFASYYMLTQFASDDGIAGGDSPHDQTGYQAAENYDMDAEVDNIGDIWQNLYFGVYRANLIIDKVASNPDATDNMKAMVGEAEFLHAYYYYQLINIWGNVVWLDKDNYSAGDFNLSNADIDEMLDKVEAELLDAISLLKDKGDLSGAEQYRATKAAARILLSKVYFMREKWAEADAQLAQITGYSLMPDYRDIWMAEFNQESIFEVPYSNQFTVGDWGNGRLNYGNMDVQLSGYREGAPGDSILAGWGFDVADPRLVKAYNDAGDMVRKNGTLYSLQWVVFENNGVYQFTPTQEHVGEAMEDVMPAGSPYLDRSDLINTPDTIFNVIDSIYFGLKRACYASLLAVANPAWNWGTNERIFRYADVLLMQAEAKFNLGDNPAATDFVNQVRARAGLPALGSVTYDDIKLERRLELAYEGHRWFDLKRWGDAATVLADDGFVVGKSEYFPIPDNEIIKAGGVLKQNPGYY